MQLKDESILRLALLSVESPLWCNDDQDDHSLTIFLYYLRGILRSSYATCLITLPSYTSQVLTLKSIKAG